MFGQGRPHLYLCFQRAMQIMISGTPFTWTLLSMAEDAAKTPYDVLQGMEGCKTCENSVEKGWGKFDRVR